MSQKEKAIARLLSRPCDYTYKEAVSLLRQLGYAENTKGKTSGSRVSFTRAGDGSMVNLHKPHPAATLKRYLIDLIIETLIENGDL